MQHHYILQATIRIRDNEFLCPIGALCEEEELNAKMKHAKVVRYRIKKIDDDLIPGWDAADWTPVV